MFTSLLQHNILNVCCYFFRIRESLKSCFNQLDGSSPQYLASLLMCTNLRFLFRRPRDDIRTVIVTLKFGIPWFSFLSWYIQTADSYKYLQWFMSLSFWRIASTYCDREYLVRKRVLKKESLKENHFKATRKEI